MRRSMATHLSMALRLPRSSRTKHWPLSYHNVAQYHDYVRFSTPTGTARIPLDNPKIVGVTRSRGERPYQEDYYTYVALSLNPEELRISLKKAHGIDWNPSSLPLALARQVLFVGIYDGHGGSTVSQYLRQELHGMFEHVRKSDIPDVYAWTKELGGYFKRFDGGVLAPWLHNMETAGEMDLEARATLAFFEIDRALAIEKKAKTVGATASVVLLQTLDNPAVPFFVAQQAALTVAHVGDTRVLLSATEGGRVIPMTENHHADARVEATRLRRMMGSGLITDSFGESRWMGALANTRSLGDLNFKPNGVTPEPQVRTMFLEGPRYSHLTLLSDGISSIVSDDEVSDLARGAPTTPRHAAQRIMTYAEGLGGEDNATALVIPLAGWGHMTGPDQTRELREYRMRQMIGNERQRDRWV